MEEEIKYSDCGQPLKEKIKEAIFLLKNGSPEEKIIARCFLQMVDNFRLSCYPPYEIEDLKTPNPKE